MSDKENKNMMPPGQSYPIPEDKLDDAGLGSVRIHNNVISVIAHEAADHVSGVVELSGTLVDGIADMIGKGSRDRGIRVAVESENTITVELTVILEYGVNIPSVCGTLQEEVRKSVEEMTGKKVQAVNVSVQGLRRAASEVTED